MCVYKTAALFWICSDQKCNKKYLFSEKKGFNKNIISVKLETKLLT